MTISYQALGVTTSSLPDGIVGKSYSTTLAAAGGTTPLTWSVSSGNLPDGLKIDSSGTISGTPQAAGTFRFTAQVSDSSSPQQTATQDLSIFIAKASTTTQLGITPSQSTAGDTITLSASITAPSGGPPLGGTVTFAANGSTVCNNVTATGGSAHCTISLNTPGTYSITANYSGDANYTGSSDTNASYTVRKAGARPSLTVAPASGATVNDSVTLTTTLQANGTADPPTGTVSFTVNGSTPPGCGGVQVVSLKASCTVDPLNAGTYTFTATYNGDSDYTATETQITGYKVGQGTPTVTLSADPASGATVGTPVSLSATVAGPQGAPAVTGTISFTADGATVPGCGSVTVTAGTATCAAGTLPAGSHSFEADYSGDTNYLAASGTLSGYDVAKATPGVSLSATPSANANVDSQISLSATVQAVNGGPAPTGTVTFLANGAAVAGCSNVSLTGGAASCPVGQLPAGTYIFEADYSGDASYLTASGTVTDYTVTKVPADVAVTSDVAAPVWGQPVTFTATVTAEGKPVSSGTVQWSVNGSPVGSPVPVGADGKASLGPLTTLAVGTDKITAGYSGTDRIAAASGTDSIVVAKADTTTKLTIIGRTLLIATVKPVAPGAGRPAGTVTFTLGGRTLGTATLSASGTAIININPTERGVISANYGGDAHFKGSSGSATLSG